MRKKYLLIISFVILASSCKKQKDIFAPPPSEGVDISFCYGNTWTDDEDLPNMGLNVFAEVVYNNKAWYFHKGQSTSSPKYIAIYDGDSWQTLSSNVPIETYPYAFTMVIGDKGYLGHTLDRTFYEYNFATNTWTQKANFPGPARVAPVTFSVGNKGYMVTGQNGAYPTVNFRDTWEYNPATNTWTQKANFPLFPLIAGKGWATGFTIGSKGYVVNGVNSSEDANTFFKTLIEYDPTADSWTVKAPFPGDGRMSSSAFVISGKAYVGGGMFHGNPDDNIIVRFKDFYKYDPADNSWTSIPDILIPASNSTLLGFAINSRGYVQWQKSASVFTLEKYTPRICPPVVGPTPGGF